jgi:hypothetical protein
MGNSLCCIRIMEREGNYSEGGVAGGRGWQGRNKCEERSGSQDKIKTVRKCVENLAPREKCLEIRVKGRNAGKCRETAGET